MSSLHPEDSAPARSVATPPVLARPEPAVVPRRRAAWWQSPWTGVLAAVGLAVVAAPWLAPYDPLAQLADGLTPLGAPLPPSGAHWLGTDDLGRDVWSRLLWGGRTSLAIASSATLLAGTLGVGLGIVAGYAGGRVDNAIMRFTEVMMAFPTLLLAIALAAVLPHGPVSVVITLALVGWTSLARLVRGNVLALREQEFVGAAYAQGAGHAWVIRRHIWPNVRALAITLLGLKLADMLLLEAALGFLGLGVAPPAPSWGAMVGEGRNYFTMAPWLAVPAGLAIFAVVLATNLLGDRWTRRKDRR